MPLEVASVKTFLAACSCSAENMSIANKEDLIERKKGLLSKQKHICEEMNDLLKGLKEASRLTQRSLEVAIVLSKRPGVIDYYVEPEKVQTIVRNNNLKKMSREVTRIQQDIDSVDKELQYIDSQTIRNNHARSVNEMTSLSQWFACHGEPKPVPNGLMSTFQNDKKVYGGTRHHKAFRSQSTTMKRGLLTR